MWWNRLEKLYWKIYYFIRGLIYGYVTDEEWAAIRKSMNIIEIETPYGTLSLIMHPLMEKKNETVL